MKKNINQALDSAEIELQRNALVRSKVYDKDDRFNKEILKESFFKRYGKEVDVQVTYEMDGPQIKEYSIEFITNKFYSLTEQLENGLTKKVILAYRKDGRDFKHEFDRYLDAEVTLADKISEED